MFGSGASAWVHLSTQPSVTQCPKKALWQPNHSPGEPHGASAARQYKGQARNLFICSKSQSLRWQQQQGSCWHGGCRYCCQGQRLQLHLVTIVCSWHPQPPELTGRAFLCQANKCISAGSAQVQGADKASRRLLLLHRGPICSAKRVGWDLAKAWLCLGSAQVFWGVAGVILGLGGA